MKLKVKTADGTFVVFTGDGQTESEALSAHGFDPDTADYTVVS